MGRQVTAEYLAGIRDGREYLGRFDPDESEIKGLIQNIRATRNSFSAGLVKDHLKGELDFWIGQLRKREQLNRE